MNTAITSAALTLTALNPQIEADALDHRDRPAGR
jgi:hypothetical protein